jgi:hypothetical protein
MLKGRSKRQVEHLQKQTTNQNDRKGAGESMEEEDGGDDGCGRE